MRPRQRMLSGHVGDGESARLFPRRLAAEQISAAGVRRAGNTTPIERVERLGGRLLLQGGELSDENPNGGIGWSMIVDESNGRMSLSGVTLEFSLVANGACMLR